eukprot:scaffold133391_cov94-Phaeocystis_antarctica.AAC.2
MRRDTLRDPLLQCPLLLRRPLHCRALGSGGLSLSPVSRCFGRRQLNCRGRPRLLRWPACSLRGQLWHRGRGLCAAAGARGRRLACGLGLLLLIALALLGRRLLLCRLLRQQLCRYSLGRGRGLCRNRSRPGLRLSRLPLD